MPLSFSVAPVFSPTVSIDLGTWVFHQEEQWSLFDAYYYCFVTCKSLFCFLLLLNLVSTVGFGDYVPLQQGGALQARPGYVVFTLLFVIVGLAVFSACVNLLVLGLVTLLYGYAFLSFMAPNADEVTAAEREPRSTIVFERFARSSSLVDSQLLTCRRQSQQPRASPKVRITLAQMLPSCQRTVIHTFLEKRTTWPRGGKAV